jgi:mRNA-degrading endonuclease RelE of RelBE toxin-antitoxin system
VSYAVVWSSPARRSIGALAEKTATAVVEYTHAVVAKNPRQAGHELHFELEGMYSARRGDFRVIYTIDDEATTVRVVAIGHHSDIYRAR